MKSAIVVYLGADRDAGRRLQLGLASTPWAPDVEVVDCFETGDAENVLFSAPVSLIVVAGNPAGAEDLVKALKQDDLFRCVPVLMVGPAHGSEAVTLADRVMPGETPVDILADSAARLVRAKLTTDDLWAKVSALQDDHVKNVVLLDLLRRYVPRTVWAMVNRFAEERRIVVPDTEEEVTIAYGDIAGFTDLSQHLRPKDVIAMLNEAYAGITQIVYANDGDIDKFIGDAFLAVFLEPLHAIRAALEIQDAMRRLHMKRTTAGMRAFQFRVGIHTGPVIRGNVGGDLRSDNTLIGDTVNTAARIEGACAPGGVLVSGASCRRAGLEIPASFAAKETLRGKDEPLLLFDVRAYETSVGSRDAWLGARARP